MIKISRYLFWHESSFTGLIPEMFKCCFRERQALRGGSCVSARSAILKGPLTKNTEKDVLA